MINLVPLMLRDILALLQQLVPPFRSYDFSSMQLPELLRGIPICSRLIQKQHYDSCTTYFDILSYNVNNVAVHHMTRRRRIMHAISTSGASILLLQETNPQWEELLRKQDKYEYSFFHHPGCNDRAAGGVSILSHFPLKDVRVLDFSSDIPGSVFPSLVCDVVLSSRHRHGEKVPSQHNLIMNIAVVHLRPPVELDGSAWLETARITEPIRLREVDELIKSTAGKVGKQHSGGGTQRPHIIAGDFNGGDGSEAVIHLTNNFGYMNALQKYVPRWKETHTWPFMRNLLLLRKRLDHILWHNGLLIEATPTGCSCGIEYRVKLECIGCGVMTGYEDGASDHQPVLARFILVKS